MFVGNQREAAIGKLVGAYERVFAIRKPEVVVLEAETGLGKTRVLQELYARLARDCQGNPCYWPARVDTATTGHVLRDRKRIVPAAPFSIPGNAALRYVWWGVVCSESEEGIPIPRLFESARQFEAHAQHLSENKPDHLDTALTLLQDVIKVVGLANPVQLAVDGLGVVKTSAAWMQRWRRSSGDTQTLVADRRIDSTSTADEKRCNQLAEAVRVAAEKGPPIVIVVDDAHHADPLMLSFLRQLTQINDGAVLIVMALWRSSVKQRMDHTNASLGSLLDSTAASFGDRFTYLRLTKLDRHDVAVLLRDAAPLTSQSIVDQFCDCIDGNPLLLRLYLDLDVIKRDIRDGSLDTDPAVFGRLPADAKGIWQELWRQLPEPARFALAVASIQGPEFHVGSVERAAAELQNFEAARSGLREAANTYGWIAAPTDELAVFTERLRYEVAQENQAQQIDPSQFAVVHRAISRHAIDMKNGPEWPSLPAATQRVVLRSHIAAARADQGVASPADVADSAFKLSLLEGDNGDRSAALMAARTAVEYGESTGLRRDEALVGYHASLGVLERDAGNEAAAFDAINAAEVLSRETLGEDNAITVALQDEVADLAIALPEVVVEDAQQPWRGWVSRSIPDLFDKPLVDTIALVEEIAIAEGPLTFARLYKLIARATESTRLGKRRQEQIERAIAGGVRRQKLVAVTPYRGCDPYDRIVASASGARVKVRTRGDRTLEEVPFTEFAKVAERVMTSGSTRSDDVIKRAVMAAYDTKRLTERVEGLMVQALRIARRELAKEQSATAGWDVVHRAVSAIPAGRWTSIQDVAELARTSPGWVGRHLYGKLDLEGLHRVLEADGRPWRWYRWPDGRDRGEVAEVLRAEGAITNGDNRGDPACRLSSADLASLVDSL